MANTLPRNPGEFAAYQNRAQFGDTPSFAVGASAALGEAMADVGDRLSSRIGKMADRAASREGEDAGMNAGAKAGAKFVQISSVEAKGRPASATAPAPTAFPATAQNSGQDVPLQLRRDGTIRSEAFDAAAVKAYGWRMQQGLLTDLAGAYDTHQDSPSGYESAVAKIRDSFLKEPLLNQGPLREVFEQTFAEKTTIGRLSVKSRHEARLRAEAAAAATDGLETLRQSMERDAYTIGGNPAGDEALKAQMNRAGRQIDALVADGTISASQAGKYRKAFENTVFAARTEGTFDALPNPEAQADFALGIMEDYAAGTGFAASLGLDEARKLSNELYSRAVRNQNAVTSERKAMTAQLQRAMADDVAAIASTGEGLDPAQSGLTADKVQSLLGSEALTQWQAAQDVAQKGWQATAGMELETSAEIADRLSALRPKVPTLPPFDPANAPGLVEAGNINLDTRPVLHNGDGTISTERSMSFEEDGLEVLVPTVFDGAVHTADEAIAHYQATGEHLGKFKSSDAAEAFAETLHQRQDARYGATSFQIQQQIYDAATKQAAQVLEERQADPLGQANRAKLITLNALDTTSQETLAASLRERRVQAETVARAYGTPSTVLRPQEVTALKQAIEAQPELLPGLASTMVTELGDLARPTLAKLSDEAPELAHAAGIAMATSDNSVAMDLADTMKRRAEKSLKLKMPDPGTLNAVAYSVMGPALSELPDGAAAVLSTAGMLYENDAARIGFDPTEVGKPGTPAATAYARALNRALGARVVNGEQWGGVTEVNGRQTIAPVDMPATSVETMVQSLTDEELRQLPAISTANGVEVRARDLHGGFLVATGDGRYRVALGDPESFDPRFLQAKDGSYWELDLRQLRSIRQAAPAAERPGSLWTYGMGAR